MRILQLIDTLDTGGAERMSVNYANGIYNQMNFSALVATRKEGGLKKFLNKGVVYKCLHKKGRIDSKAIKDLIHFIKANKIEYIHAHSSSFFLAIICKIFLPKLKVIWHDHYGNSEFLDKRPNIMILKLFSLLFYGTISVNEKLKSWAEKKLFVKKIIYLPNFISNKKSDDKNSNPTILKGEQGKRIICLANLRPQKNHDLLIKVAEKVSKIAPDWTFHLVGKDFKDPYADLIKTTIKDKKLENHIFMYGSRNDIDTILDQAEIGILTSLSEGLPVSLLEYGLHKLAVVSTNVGEVATVIKSSELGLMVESNNTDKFVNELVKIIQNQELRNTLKNEFHNHILINYEEDQVIKNYLQWISIN